MNFIDKDCTYPVLCELEEGSMGYELGAWCREGAECEDIEIVEE